MPIRCHLDTHQLHALSLSSVLALSLITPSSAVAQTPAPTQLLPPLTETHWAAYNHMLVRELIVPGYRQFAENAAALAQSSQAYCQGDEQVSLTTLKRDFLATSFSWQQVQGWRFGPIEFELRHPRIQTWPDRSNAGGRQLRRLLKLQDAEMISAERLERGSTALQGLPVLERMLYAQNAPENLKNAEGQAQFGCQFFTQVTQGLHHMGQGLVKNWTDEVEPNRFVYEMLEPSPNSGIFESNFEVSALLINHQITQIQFMQTRKLATPLGLDSGKARFRKAENWRSHTSLHNLRQNIWVLSRGFSSHDGLGDLLDRHGKPDTRQAIEQQLAHIDQLLSQLGGSLVIALEQQPEALGALNDAIERLYTVYRNDMLQALDVAEAFNALDGD